MAQDPYVKLLFDYYDDVVIEAIGDDGEVMFTRGLAFSGRAGTNGFIQTSKLTGLCRKKSLRDAVRLADKLTKPVAGFDGPWVKVQGGYMIRNWEKHQHELMALQARRASDAKRQREKRAADRAAQLTPDALRSRDLSRDRPSDVTDPSKARVNAAAAAVPAAGGDGLTAELRVFRDKLRAVPAFSGISFEIEQSKLDTIHELVILHGDARLIETALRTSFHPVPAFASAFLKKWRALPAPGQLQLVDDRCPECGLTITACDAKAKTDPEFCPRKESA